MNPPAASTQHPRPSGPDAPRAIVMGLGPAGRAAAHRAAARGWRVLALDPSGGSMPSTVGSWVHQLPGWLPRSAVASRFRPSVIAPDGRRRVLADDYAVLDTGILAELGGFEVRREAAIGGVGFKFSAKEEPGASGIKGALLRVAGVLGRVPALFRPDPDEGPSARLLDEPDDADEDDGLGEWFAPDVVVDATPGQCRLPIRQLAYGQIFDAADIPERHRFPVLMDFTVPPASSADGAHGADSNASRAAESPSGYPATFSYRLPLGDGRWLIEETILAAHVDDPGDAGGEPGRPVAAGETDAAELKAHLRRMQARRLRSLGVDPDAAVAEENVDFPVAPCGLPDNRPRTPLRDALAGIPLRRDGSVLLDLGFLAAPFSGRGVPGYGTFGAAGGWMHPATGYSVGAVLADADRFLDRLADRGNANPPGGVPLAWLRRRGLHVLLSFDARHARAFFDAFFRLDDRHIRTYLTGGSVTGTLAVMLRLGPVLAVHSPATLGRLLRAFLSPARTLSR